MELALSTDDLLDLADVCNEFSGDDISFCELLAHPVVPLRCLHARVFCLVTQRHVINCMTTHADVPMAAPSWEEEHTCTAMCGKVGGAGILQSAEGVIKVRTCAEMHGPDSQVLVTSRHHYAARMWEGQLTFVAPSPACDRHRALRLIRLIAPHLHAALMRVRSADSCERPRLTRAEKRVAHGLLCGRTNKEIAKVLGKSDATIRNQLHSLFGKLGVNRRAAAIELLTHLTPDGMPFIPPTADAVVANMTMG